MQTTIDKPDGTHTLSIIGRDASGTIVARDVAPHPTRAETIARTWRDAGLAVAIHPRPTPPNKPR